MNAPIHTFNDGSTLHTLSAMSLVKIPIWKGNRILDTVHAAAIQKAIGSAVHPLDSGYRIVEYEEADAGGNVVVQTYLIDGQHRAHILKEHFEGLCEPDFTVLVTKRRVEDESGAIAFFNAINNCKPQAWRLEPNLIINKYIAALVKKFNGTKKVKLIRPGATHRPYLSSDKLRDILLMNLKDLKQTNEEVREFVERVAVWNTQEVGAAQMSLSLGDIKKDVTILERSIDIGFILAFDGTYRWIRACLG